MGFTPGWSAVADQLKLHVLDDWISADVAGQPFFAFLYFSSSHFPYEQPENRTPLFTPVELSSHPAFLYYDRSLAPLMRNRYFNTLHFIDGLLGELVARLEELGVLKDTVLFITGDQAHSREFSEDAYKRAAEPKELFWVKGAGHVDLYDRLDLIPFDKLTVFFDQHLAA